MLAKVVSEGTGEPAEVPGYDGAGKTGTARIPQNIDPEDGYLNAQGRYEYQASFVGFVIGADLSIIVTVEEPRTSIYGADVAAPVFAHLAATALRRYEVPPAGLQDSAVQARARAVRLGAGDRRRGCLADAPQPRKADPVELRELVTAATGRGSLDACDLVGDPTADVTAATHDSRQVRAGTLFCCVPGPATTATTSRRPRSPPVPPPCWCERPLDLGVPEVVVPVGPRRHGPAARRPSPASRRSSSQVVGVTGTNGKTTIAHLLGSDRSRPPAAPPA